MFYEIIKELTNVRYNTSVWKKYGTDFHRLILDYGELKSDIHNKSLCVMKKVANTLDVPIDFIISIINYEGVEEFDTIGGATNKASGDTKEEVFQQHD